MPRRIRWMKSEEDFLVENYKKYSADQLAFMLTEKFGRQRTKKSVLRKLEEMRKKGITEPLDMDDVKQRKSRKKLDESVDILNGGYRASDYVYEEV